MVFWIVSVASAADFGMALGVETVVNDPYLASTGLRLGFVFRLDDLVELRLNAAGYPRLGGLDCEGNDGSSCYTLERAGVYLDKSHVLVASDLTLGVFPIRARSGRWEVAVGIEAGLGLVLTETEVLSLTPQSEAPEFHLAGVGGVVGELSSRIPFFRAYARDQAYVETFYGTVLQTKSRVLVGIEGGAWF